MNSAWRLRQALMRSVTVRRFAMTIHESGTAVVTVHARKSRQSPAVDDPARPRGFQNGFGGMAYATILLLPAWA